MSEWHTGWTEGYASARDEMKAELAAEREAKQCAVDQAETFREERDAMRALLLRWDALIEHQYTGSREAMSDMMECAQMTAQTLYGDPPWPNPIEAALKGDGDE
jgi:hypothetical protein